MYKLYKEQLVETTQKETTYSQERETIISNLKKDIETNLKKTKIDNESWESKDG